MFCYFVEDAQTGRRICLCSVNYGLCELESCSYSAGYVFHLNQLIVVVSPIHLLRPASCDACLASLSSAFLAASGFLIFGL